MSNSLDPDQDRRFVGPDLGPNFLQRLSTKIASFCCRLLTFLNQNTIRVSNSLDPDQDRHFVSPDLGPTCLLKLST